MAPAQIVDEVFTLFHREQVDVAFGVPGSALAPLYEKLASGSTRMRHILARHEAGAAFMAYGYARVARRLGLCLATTGPGATNAMTGIACAHADFVPVMMLTGQTVRPWFGRGALQESTPFGLDTVELFRSMTKLSAMPTVASQVTRYFEHALRVATSGAPGPVHLSLSPDLMKEPSAGTVDARPLHGSRARPVDVAAAREAAMMLASAKRPCLLAGSGVALSGAWSRLEAFATRWKAPIATTPKAKDVFPESHPLALGQLGLIASPRAEGYVLDPSCDLLIVVGSSLGELATNQWDPRLVRGRPVVQIDVEPAVIGRRFPVDLAVVGDVDAVLTRIDEALGQMEPTALVDRSALVHDLSAPMQLAADWETSDGKGFRPQQLVAELQAELPPTALLFVDNGTAVFWAGNYLTVDRPHSYFTSLGLASMGIAIGAAIGAKVAAPDAPVVSLVGDAAFAMNGLEIATAVDHDLPCVWIVLNNQGHGTIFQAERMLFGRDLGACVWRSKMNIAGVAEALGARSYVATSAETFRTALKDALRSNRPCVIDAHIDPDEVPPHLSRRASAVRKGLSLGGPGV